MATITEINEQGTALFNKGDVEGFAALYAEDAVLVTPEGRFQGRGDIQAYFQAYLTGFPDAQVTLGRSGEQGELYFAEFSFAGTHTGPLGMPDGSEVPPTGKVVQTRSAELVRVEQGKVTQHDMYWDSMELLTQLGLVPAP